MANSYDTYTGNGSTSLFAVTFPYISQSEVSVTVSGQSVPFTFPTSSQVQLATAPAVGAAIKVFRTTAIASQDVTFADGTTVRAADLNLALQQVLYGLQDAADNYAAGLAAALGNPTQLPGVNAGNNGSILGVAGGQWAVLTTAALGFGTAAFVNTGTSAAQVPLNSQLGAAAYVGLGTGGTQVPQNSNLGSAAYLPSTSFERVLSVNNTASATLTNVTSGQFFNANFTLPANTFSQQGKCVRVKAGGTVTVNAAQTFSISMWLASNGWQSANITTGGSGTFDFWIEMVFTLHSAPGSSASLGGIASFTIGAASSAGTATAGDGGDVSFNTTTTNIVEVQFATNLANNSAILNTLLVEALN